MKKSLQDNKLLLYIIFSSVCLFGTSTVASLIFAGVSIIIKAIMVTDWLFATISHSLALNLYGTIGLAIMLALFPAKSTNCSIESNLRSRSPSIPRSPSPIRDLPRCPWCDAHASDSGSLSLDDRPPSYWPQNRRLSGDEDWTLGSTNNDNGSDSDEPLFYYELPLLGPPPLPVARTRSNSYSSTDSY